MDVAEKRRVTERRAPSFEEVVIRRAGKNVILEPKKRRQWPRGYWTSWGKVPADFQAPDPLPAGHPRVRLDER